MRRLVTTFIIALAAILLNISVGAVEPVPGFGVGGISFIKPKNVPQDVRLGQQSSGKIIAAYTYQDLQDRGYVYVTRLKAKGVVDSKFGSNGWKPVTLAGYSLFLNELQIDSQNRIVLYLWAKTTVVYPPRTDLAIIRLTPSGQIDTSFGSRGAVIIPNPTGTISLRAGFVDKADADAIYLAGGYDWEPVIYKFDASGAPVNGFGTGGKFVVDTPGPHSTFSGLTRDNTGHIVAAGYIRETGEALVTRLSTGGVPDTAFSDDGTMTFPYSGFDHNEGRMHIGVTADNRLVIAGDNGARLATARVTDGGLLDTGFGVAGFAETDTDGVLRAMRLYNGSPLVIAQFTGAHDESVLLVRYTPDGIPDGTFGQDGLYNFDPYGGRDFVDDMFIASDGSIFIGGTFTTLSHSIPAPDRVLMVAKLDAASGSGLGMDRRALTINSSFEYTSVAYASNILGWEIKGRTDDGRACTRKSIVINSLIGKCAFRFIGGPGENSSIKQTIAYEALNVLTAGDVIGYSVTLRSPFGVKFMLKATLTDGTQKKLVAAMLPASGGTTRVVADGIIVPVDVASLQVLINHRGTSGVTDVDDVMVWVQRSSQDEVTRMRLLPVPPLPAP